MRLPLATRIRLAHIEPIGLNSDPVVNDAVHDRVRQRTSPSKACSPAARTAYRKSSTQRHTFAP